MNSLRIIIAVFVSIASVACASKKTAATIEVYKVCFGSFGGFTGIKEEYCLKESGLLYTLNDSAGFLLSRPLKQVDSTLVKKIFRYAVSEDFLKMNLNNPANMTGFISVHRDSTKLQEIKWPFGEQVPEAAADSLIRQLFALLP